MAFDEARFGLINWHKKRYCPKGFRPPYIVQRAYEWTYLYIAVDPATGESFCLYHLPGLDSTCFEAFLKHLGEAYADYRLVLVLDNAPSHISKEITLPQNVSLLAATCLQPRAKPCGEVVSGVQACTGQQGFRDYRIPARCADAST